MMRFSLLLSLCILCSFKSNRVTIDLVYIRNHYEQAITNKEICTTMIDVLKKSKRNNIELAYLGGLQTIWANHTINPLAKLKTFDTGKANIEQAVSNEKDNVEIRFVRLSVQKNCPKFLGYSKSITEDESYIKQHLTEVQPESLKKMIANVLNN
ncbi:MAG: hypothetical protein V4538_13220 [Bacteroidota bacterium]